MDLKALSSAPWENVYHVGVVVEDIVKASLEIGEELGLTFAEPRPANVTMRDAGGDGPQTVIVAFASQGPPYMELLQATTPGIWSATGGPGIHHVGLWTDDIAKDVARFTKLGLRLEAHGIDGNGDLTFFAYMRDAQGIRVELVSSAGRAGFMERFST